MGLFDKVKDFLDDGKINGSTKKSEAQNEQTTQNAPVQDDALARAQAIAEQQKAIREAAGIKEPEPLSKEERYAMIDEIIEQPFSIDASMIPYQDADGNNVCVKMSGKVVFKALYDASDKGIIPLVVKAAPQQAYFDVLMKNQVPADQLATQTEAIKQAMAQALKQARDFEVQSIIIHSITG